MIKIFQKVKNEISLNSLRLFALFVDDERDFAVKGSVLHLNVTNRTKSSVLETATITHISFTEINQYISETIIKKSQQLSMAAYLLVLFIAAILFYKILDAYGLIISLLLLEKHVQLAILTKINEYILLKLKHKFLNDLYLHLKTYG